MRTSRPCASTWRSSSIERNSVGSSKGNSSSAGSSTWKSVTSCLRRPSWASSLDDPVVRVEEVREDDHGRERRGACSIDVVHRRAEPRLALGPRGLERVHDGAEVARRGARRDRARDVALHERRARRRPAGGRAGSASDAASVLAYSSFVSRPRRRGSPSSRRRRPRGRRGGSSPARSASRSTCRTCRTPSSRGAGSRRRARTPCARRTRPTGRGAARGGGRRARPPSPRARGAAGSPSLARTSGSRSVLMRPRLTPSPSRAAARRGPRCVTPSLSARKLVMHAVASTGRGERADVLDVRREAAVEDRARLGAEDEVLDARGPAPQETFSCTKSGAPGSLGARRADEVHRVADDVVGGRDAPHELLQLADLLGREHAVERRAARRWSWARRSPPPPRPLG